MYKCTAATEDGEREKVGTIDECCSWADDLALEEGTIRITLVRLEDGERAEV